MEIELNFEKKHFWILTLMIIIVSGIIFVYAYGGSNPEFIGHSSGEIQVEIDGVNMTLQDAVEGDYTGTIMVGALEIPVKLTVWPLALPDEFTILGCAIVIGAGIYLLRPRPTRAEIAF